jgi:hypothetical protein
MWVQFTNPCSMDQWIHLKCNEITWCTRIHFVVVNLVTQEPCDHFRNFLPLEIPIVATASNTLLKLSITICGWSLFHGSSFLIIFFVYIHIGISFTWTTNSMHEKKKTIRKLLRFVKNSKTFYIVTLLKVLFSSLWAWPRNCHKTWGHHVLSFEPHFVSKFLKMNDVYYMKVYQCYNV